jgi:2,6-dihydroxypyridine 3-monooxygenase
VTLRVVVVGGSIGGLSTALLLSDLGLDVEVFERADAALQARGAGIVVLPVTERYLVERAGDRDRVSLELRDWTYIDHQGRVLASDADHYRFAGWSSIYGALLDAFDRERYHLDAAMVDLDRHDDGVTVHLHDGRTVTGDLVVAADGVGSTARALLLPDVGPTYAGYVAWRGVIDEAELSSDARGQLTDAMLYQILDDGHILAYAIPGADGTTTPGRRTVNVVWYRNYAAGHELDDLMTGPDGRRWATTVPPGHIRGDHLAEMRGRAEAALAPTFAELMLTCDRPMIQVIADVEVPQMVFGRVCLLGDAAFGLRPHLAAGQAKACADAWALHDALLDADLDIDTALARWQRSQLALGRSALERTRRMGVRSQFEHTMVPGDPTWKFGLWRPGD